MSVSATAAPPIGAGSQSQSQTASLNTLNQGDFLHLLIAQLQKQNPLHPAKNQQLAQEMADFSTASGVSAMKKSLGGLKTQIRGAQSRMVSQWVGQSVAISGNGIESSNGTARGAIKLPQSASDVQVVITQGGQTEKTLNLGAMNSGLHTFKASGLSNGRYHYHVKVNGKTDSNVETFNVGQVQAVHLGRHGQESNVVVNGNDIPASQVQDIL